MEHGKGHEMEKGKGHERGEGREMRKDKD
jgi:hypothetical protein